MSYIFVLLMSIHVIVVLLVRVPLGVSLPFLYPGGQGYKEGN
jgi:hypothetical protein